MVRGHLQRYHHVPRSRITVIPNAIDADRLQVAQPGAVRCAFRNRIGLEPDDLVGLFVGHNYWLKGLKPLLTASPGAGRTSPPRGPSTCSSAARGRPRRSCGWPAGSAWRGRSTSPGFVPDIRACYWSSDFFVSPTYYDPCSLAVLEALACGLPVITTACNGAGELMTNGREGFVIPAPDAFDELAGALGAMTDDEARRPDGRARRTAGPVADVRPPCDAARSRCSRRWPPPSRTAAPMRRSRSRQSTSRSKLSRWSRPSRRERTRDDMKAVLLAGGKGTRLRPFTHVFPKPLMPLGDADPMPIIEVVLRQLARFGFRDVTVITGYLTELIEAFCGSGRKFGTRLTYRRELTPLGTAGGLTLIDRPDEPVLVINGDILTTLDFAEMYRFHVDRGASATIASYPREVRIDFGVLEFGDDPHVLTGYREKPEFSFQVSMGVYILDPVAWDFLTPGQALPMPDLLEAMRQAGKAVHCFRQDCYWLDIGRHDDYATANDIFEARRASFLGEPEKPKLHHGT